MHLVVVTQLSPFKDTFNAVMGINVCLFMAVERCGSGTVCLFCERGSLLTVQWLQQDPGRELHELPGYFMKLFPRLLGDL